MSCASLCATLDSVFLFSSAVFKTVCLDRPQIVDATFSTLQGTLEGHRGLSWSAASPFLAAVSPPRLSV